MEKIFKSDINKIFRTENIFYEKLRDWYGKNLMGTQVSLLHTIDIGGEICTVVFIVQNGTKIEIVRIFQLGDNVEISIDLKVNISTIGSVKTLIEYGANNFDRNEIADE